MSCYLWEEKLQGTVASTIRSILNAAMICHGADGGRTFRNAAWDHMTGCLTHYDGALRSEFPAYVRNAGNLTPNPCFRALEGRGTGVGALV